VLLDGVCDWADFWAGAADFSTVGVSAAGLVWVALIAEIVILGLLIVSISFIGPTERKL
jgi:hypothetical protein